MGSLVFTPLLVFVQLSLINVLPQKLLERCNFWKPIQRGITFPTPSPASDSALVGIYKS